MGFVTPAHLEAAIEALRNDGHALSDADAPMSAQSARKLKDFWTTTSASVVLDSPRRRSILECVRWSWSHRHIFGFLNVLRAELAHRGGDAR